MTGRPLTWYVRSITFSGGVVAVDSLARAASPGHSYEWLAFAVLGMLAGSLTIRVATVEASISVADTFFIAAAMLFGPAATTAAIALDSLVLSLRKGHNPMRVGFNVAAPSLSLWVAAHAFFVIARMPPLAVAGVALPPALPL